MLVVFFVESGKHLRGRSCPAPCATSCLPSGGREGPPGDFPSATPLPLLLSSSLLATPLSLSVLAHSSPWPSPPIAARDRPLPPRRAEKVHSAALFLPYQGIDRNRPALPPNRRITSPDLTISAAEFVISGHPPARPTSPAVPR
jgi:hypothetical protein